MAGWTKKINQSHLNCGRSTKPLFKPCSKRGKEDDKLFWSMCGGDPTKNPKKTLNFDDFQKSFFRKWVSGDYQWLSESSVSGDYQCSLTRLKRSFDNHLHQLFVIFNGSKLEIGKKSKHLFEESFDFSEWTTIAGRGRGRCRCRRGFWLTTIHRFPSDSRHSTPSQEISTHKEEKKEKKTNESQHREGGKIRRNFRAFQKTSA